MTKKTEIDFLIEQIEMDNLGSEGQMPKSCSEWLKSVYSKSNAIKFDINYLKAGIPELVNKDDKEIARHLIDGIMKYDVGQYDTDPDEIEHLINVYYKGGLESLRGGPAAGAGSIAYYVAKKMGINVPKIQGYTAKDKWFNQSILDDVNLYDTAGTNATSYHDALYGSDEARGNNVPKKKKKKIFGLF